MVILAEMEKELIVERTPAGREAAKHLERRRERKREMTNSKLASAKKLIASCISPRDTADNLNISIPTLYRWPAASMRLN